MTLYDMLTYTLCYQEVWIYECDNFDKNMLVFRGSVEDARKDDYVWDYLTNEVGHYECGTGILLIMVKSPCYKEGLENNYSVSAEEWGKDIAKRPWRYLSEIRREIIGNEEERL